MRTLKCLAGLAIAAGACTVAYAGGPKNYVEPVLETAVAKVEANVAAQIVPIGDGRFRITKPWTALNVGSRTGAGQCGVGVAFDAMDINWSIKDPNDPNYAFYYDRVGGPPNRCGVPQTARYRLCWAAGCVPPFTNPHHIDDMQGVPASYGQNSYEMMFAYNIRDTVPLANPSFAILTWDGVSEDPNFCSAGDPNDPNAVVSNFLSGVIVGFQGPLPIGHIVFLVNLCRNNPQDIHWVLPTGRGAMQMAYGTAVPDPQDPNIINIQLGEGQPMLWYNWNNNGAQVWALPGTQGSLHFDDDGGVAAPPEQPDGQFDIFTECYGYYPFGIPCPGNNTNGGDPAGGRLATAISWTYGNRGGGGPQCSCTGDIAPSGNPNGVVDINDLTLLLSNFGITPADPCIDVNGSGGPIDINDLTALLSAFGSTCP